MAKKKKVLVTGVGSPGGPGIVRAILSANTYEVFGTDIDKRASGRYFVSQFFLNKL